MKNFPSSFPLKQEKTKKVSDCSFNLSLSQRREKKNTRNGSTSLGMNFKLKLTMNHIFCCLCICYCDKNVHGPSETYSIKLVFISQHWTESLFYSHQNFISLFVFTALPVALIQFSWPYLNVLFPFKLMQTRLKLLLTFGLCLPLRWLNQLYLSLMDWFTFQMSKETQLNCYSIRLK